MNHRIKLIGLLALGLLLFLAACSSDAPPEDTSQTTAVETTEEEAAHAPEAPEEAGESSAPAETLPSDPVISQDEPAVEPEVEPAAEPASEPGEPTESQPVETPDEPSPREAFAKASIAIDELNSYRFTTSFIFVGEEDGETETGSLELSGIIASPDRKQFRWSDLSSGEVFEIVQIDERAWSYSDGTWDEVPSFVAEAMGQAALVYAPSVTWSGLFGTLQPDASYVGTEWVNGVQANHFKATYQQWGAYWQGDLVDAVGDIWIAAEGYPVRYAFSATGVDEAGNRGTVSWTMDLSDVNQVIEIDPPTVGDAEEEETY